MKYFRTYPWGLQLLLFLTMTFTFMSAAGVIIASLLPRFGINPAQLGGLNPNSPAAIINVEIIVQGASSIFIWMMPAFLFAYLTHPRPAQYIGLRAPGRMVQPLLAILIMLGAMPLLEVLSGLMSQLPFSPAIKANQAAEEGLTNAFLNMPTFASFLKVFVILSIIPGIGEEMFFRGVMMRFVKKKSTSMAAPVLFTALLFALVHFNVYGFISIFFAGVLLAVIYNLTGSLWCSILAHLFFNGTQIILSYAGNSNPTIKNYMSNTDIPYYLVVGGAIVAWVSFYLLLKYKTPLPADWAEDYTPEEQDVNSKFQEPDSK